ncbi:ATP-binding protein [Bifidobacterium eulemuris]|uniref:ATPase AAA n=1 Tax=Bifidobacterium eulemuris TaxID=1765219 RepID=A0A261GB85_9BIFI|nr:ATP-binding protein [Bifidobacterium eulemuris]OZG68692.1 ATPase AAA [Bifidobacterium eulemuris]QOL32802.1 putative DNA binding domain-containing protein [Bifidobacterium eulemuris]
MPLLRESSTVEFKRQLTEWTKKEIIAFANCEGGDLYIGFDDDGNPVGIDNPDSVMGAVGDMIRNAIRPDLTAYTDITCECMNDAEGKPREIVHVTVLRGTQRPYYLRNKGLTPPGVFIRHGVSSVPASEHQIRRLLRESDDMAFDSSPCLRQELTFEYAAAYFRKHDVQWGENQRRTLGLVNDNELYTNTALLLSDQCHHTIKSAVFSGSTKASAFIDRREFTGSILQQLEDAYRFLELNNTQSATFDGLYRNDHYAWPPSALREALLNAIVHRDYDSTGTTFINIYDDRAEFISPGGLPLNIALADALNGMSMPRNRTLAEVFYRLRLIESYGMGIPSITRQYEGCGSRPWIQTSPAFFSLTLPRQNGPSNSGGETVPQPRGGGSPSRPSTIAQERGERRHSYTQFATLGEDLAPADEANGLIIETVAQQTPTTISRKGAPDALILAPVQGDAHIVMPDGSVLDRMELRAAGHVTHDDAQPQHHTGPLHQTAPPEETASSTAPPPTSSELERLTLELIAKRNVPMSRLEIEQALGINKNRAAYVLRKLEKEGSIVSSGSARSTSYALA